MSQLDKIKKATELMNKADDRDYPGGVDQFKKDVARIKIKPKTTKEKPDWFKQFKTDNDA